jgi:hypothetical protein
MADVTAVYVVSIGAYLAFTLYLGIMLSIFSCPALGYFKPLDDTDPNIKQSNLFLC